MKISESDAEREVVRRVRSGDLPWELWTAGLENMGLRFRTLGIGTGRHNAARTVIVDVPTQWESEAELKISESLDLYVISGDLAINGDTFSTGSYLYWSGEKSIGTVESSGGARLILWWNQMPAWVSGRQSGSPLSAAHPEIVVDTRSPGSWQDYHSAFPGDNMTSHAGASGASAVAKLRSFDSTGAEVIMFKSPRGKRKNCLEVHESREEIFVVAGWVATDDHNVYEAGDYLVWGPGCVHGPVTTWGSITISKHYGRFTSERVPLAANAIDVGSTSVPTRIVHV